MSDETQGAPAPKPKVAYLQSPNGGVSRIPLEDASFMLGQGWHPATQEQVDALKLTERASTLPQQALGAAEQAAGTLTFGATPWLERELGVDPKMMAARAQTTGGTLGSVAALAVPLLGELGGAALAGKAGVGALKSAAKFTAPGLITRAGGGVGSAAERLLPKFLGEGVTKNVARLATGATEGALYQLGSNVSEAALGDPEDVGETLLANVGPVALMGGALHLGGGLLGELGKKAIAKVTTGSIGEKLAGWMEGSEAEWALKTAGATKSELKAAQKTMGREELMRIGKEAREMGVIKPFSSPTGTLERIDEVLEKAQKVKLGVLEAADQQGAVRLSMDDIAGRIRQEVLKPLEKNPFADAVRKNLDETLGRYQAIHGPDGTPLTFKSAWELRKQLDDEVYGLKGVKDPNANKLTAALRDARQVLDEELGNGIERAGLDSNAWRAANREQRVALTIQKIAQSAADRQAGNMGPLSLSGLLGGVAGASAHGIPGGLIGSMAVQGLRNYGSDLKLLGAEALRKGGALDALRQMATSKGELQEKLDELGAQVLSGKRGALVAHTPPEEFGARAARVREFAGNLQLAQEHLSRSVEDVAEHAPNVASALQVTAARAASFLSSKLPSPDRPGPLASAPMASEDQKWRWNRYYDAIQEPTSLLQHAAHGTLTPMDLEAVGAVYPKLLARMRSSVLEHLMSRHEDAKQLPYPRRLMLSMLLGQDLDGTLRPQAIQANQLVFQMPTRKSQEDIAAPRPGAARPSQAGLGKLKLGHRMMTRGQAAQERLEEA